MDKENDNGVWTTTADYGQRQRIMDDDLGMCL